MNFPNLLYLFFLLITDKIKAIFQIRIGALSNKYITIWNLEFENNLQNILNIVRSN